MTDTPFVKQTIEHEESEDSSVKNWLINYVGEKHQPEDDNVTVEMIVDTMADEFPEFLLAVAEENWIRGYQQAIHDVSNSEQYLPSPEEGDTLKVTFPDDEEVEGEEQDDVECGA